MRKIKVYTANHSPEDFWLRHLVHPVRAFWGDGTAEWEKWKQGFEFYKNYFELTSTIEDSEVGFLPLTLNYYIKNNQLSKVDQLTEALGRKGKKLIVWIDGDHAVRYKNQNCIFIRYCGEKSTKRINEIIQPGDMKTDLLKEFFNGNILFREKGEKPIVGFDGIANYPSVQLVGTIIKNSVQKFSHSVLKTQVSPDPVIPFLIKRKQILKKLDIHNGIKTNFTIRESFAPGTIGGNKNARKEFVNNIINSDYTLCYRGAGNYSLRLYETLCLGRIPLFINTDCVLPFENKIPWQDICLWVEENEMDKIGEKIINHHNSLSNTHFKDRQYQCREIWDQFCTDEGFINHFHSGLIKHNCYQEKGAIA